MDFLINGGTIIKRVCEAGAEIMLVGDKIRVQPVSVLPKELLNDMRQYKEDVIQALPLYPVDLIQKIYMRGMSKHGHALEERAIIKAISPLDWADVSERYDFELQYWANEITPSVICNCGLVPHDWSKVAKCHNCGWVFSSKSGDCLACPWCEVRAAGVWFPTPGLNRCANPEIIDGCVVQECKVQPGIRDVVIHECFFCGERHLHGAGDDNWGKNVRTIGGIRHLGRREKHCIRKGIEITLPDCTVVRNDNGYYLGVGDQTPHGM